MYVIKLYHATDNAVLLWARSSMAHTYRLDNEVKGSTQNRNPRSHTIKPKHKACGFYMASKVSMEHRSCWPCCLTNLEYSNCCYAAEVFRLQAFVCITLHACFVEEQQQMGL